MVLVVAVLLKLPGTYPGGTGTANQGYAGGTGYSSGYENFRGGGGGGAGAAGSDGGPSSGEGTKGDGGIGVQVLIAGTCIRSTSWNTRPSPGGGYFAGGGAAGTQGPTGSSGGKGGGADGGDSGQDAPGNPVQSIASTGGGGGGGGPSGGDGTSGSSGIVVRYQIATAAETAKASGGAISFYSGKTIHTFTSTGTFTAPGPFNETVDYVVVAGGGAGGFHNTYGGGGGGAGAVRIGSLPLSGPFSSTFTVGAGGVAVGTNGAGADGGTGTDSTLAHPGTNITAAGGGGGGGGLLLQAARAAVLAAAVLMIMVEVEPVLVLYIRDHHQRVLHQLDGR